MSADIALIILIRHPVDQLCINSPQISDSATFLTDNMAMILRSGIKPVTGFPTGDFHNLSLVCKESQITVDCSQTDIGINFADRCIHHIRCRVILSACKIILNSLSLPAVFQCCHPYSPFSFNINNHSRYFYSVSKKAESCNIFLPFLSIFQSVPVHMYIVCFVAVHVG